MLPFLFLGLIVVGALALAGTARAKGRELPPVPPPPDVVPPLPPGPPPVVRAPPPPPPPPAKIVQKIREIEATLPTVPPSRQTETVQRIQKLEAMLPVAPQPAQPPVTVPPPTPEAPPLRAPLLRVGARGKYVAMMQTKLKALGYPIAVDGIFGRGTERHVKAFQASRGLRPDGIVGSNTWAALRS